jgi:uncharacterized membrane protein
MTGILWLANGLVLQGQGPGPYQGPWGWHYGMMGGGWGMIFMIISMILFWGLIIGGRKNSRLKRKISSRSEFGPAVENTNEPKERRESK